jgi:hypothetical protein
MMMSLQAEANLGSQETNWGMSSEQNPHANEVT